MEFTKENSKLIEKTKDTISLFMKFQDSHFEYLCTTLGIDEVHKNFLFDYIYNYRGQESFEEYLDKFKNKSTL